MTVAELSERLRNVPATAKIRVEYDDSGFVVLTTNQGILHEVLHNIDGGGQVERFQ